MVEVVGEKQEELETSELHAFQMGWMLHDYFSVLEYSWVWPVDSDETKHNFEGPISLQLRRLIGVADKLSKTLRNQNDGPFERLHLPAVLENLPSQFEVLMEENNRENEATKYAEQQSFYDEIAVGEIDDEQAATWERLFSPQVSNGFRNLMYKVHESACNFVEPNDALQEFFQIGFNLPRLSEVLKLDDIFPFEIASPNMTRKYNLETFLSGLIRKRKKRHSGLNDADTDLRLDPFNLIENIQEALGYGAEGFDKYGLGLTLYPSILGFTREGYSKVGRLSSGQWSILECVAPTTNGSFCTLRDLDDCYSGRSVNSRSGDSSDEDPSNPLAVARSRLNNGVNSYAGLNEFGLTLKYHAGEKGYRLEELQTNEDLDSSQH